MYNIHYIVAFTTSILTILKRNEPLHVIDINYKLIIDIISKVMLVLYTQCYNQIFVWQNDPIIITFSQNIHKSGNYSR